MLLAQKIALNTIIQTLGKTISIALGIIAMGIMTRYLGVSDFGAWTTALAFLQFFAIIADFGLALTANQMISIPGANIEKTLSNIFTLRFFTSLILFGLVPLFVLIFPYPPIVKLIISLNTISFFFNSLIQVMTALFQKELKMARVSGAEIIGRITIIIFILIAIKADWGLLGMVFASSGSTIVNFILLYFATRVATKLSFSFDFELWRQILKKTWPIAISIIFNLIYLKGDTIILSLFRPADEVGIYGASFRVLEILIMVPTMFMGLILPILTHNWINKNKEKFNQIMQMAFDAIIIMAIPAVIIIWFLAAPIMILIAGPEFAKSGEILKILILASGMLFIGTFYGHTIVALEKQKLMIWGYLATAIIALFAYLTFIPRYSYFGAAWATVLAESLIAITTFTLVTYYTNVFPRLKTATFAILSGLICAVILYFSANLNLFVQLFLSGFSYLTALYVLGVIKKENIMEIIAIKK